MYFKKTVIYVYLLENSRVNRTRKVLNVFAERGKVSFSKL